MFVLLKLYVVVVCESKIASLTNGSLKVVHVLNGTLIVYDCLLCLDCRRNITMLGTHLDSLQSLLSNPSLTKSLNEKDLSKQQDRFQSLHSRMNQMSNSLNSSNRINLLGQNGRGEPKENNRTTGLDNYGTSRLQ
ncbi:hypothetical protein GOP47_0017328 [Adiantum capillus-veneris]|uniref:Uncharacterized protein n=1 Tax=Adiantum capillus-veneris TaxID=13818 RepID=A0A9D4UF86_ADICA|nr:hypothetical protein GOP47_0017328 [Adiantum capillus-veneris]